MSVHNEKVVDQFTRQADAFAAAAAIRSEEALVSLLSTCEPRPGDVTLDVACAPGGRVVVMDMVAPNNPIKAAVFNRMERLRDPSHVSALTREALSECFAQQGVPVLIVRPYRMNVELDRLKALARATLEHI